MCKHIPIFVSAMTHFCERNKSFVCHELFLWVPRTILVPRTIRECHESATSHSCAMNYSCATNYSCECHELFLWVPRTILVSATNYFCECHELFLWVPRTILVSATRAPQVILVPWNRMPRAILVSATSHFLCVMWLIRLCDVTRWDVWQDSFRRRTSFCNTLQHTAVWLQHTATRAYNATRDYRLWRR